jgi:prepilin signal peptidase PulO-like enzyme (type II secretory pathway)
VESSTIIILFAFGLVIGSFLNATADRYDGEHFLFSTKLIGGRSHCTHCGKILQWFELIPLVSFIIQRGHCRYCKKRLTFQYFISELISGLIFVFVPLQLGSAAWPISALWIAAFELMFVMALIDIRLGIIPDEINIFLGVIAIGIGYASGFQGDFIANRIIAAAVAGGFFGLLILITRGRGMGLGDLKLAIPLGLLFGWPNVLAVLMLAFVIGAAVGLIAIARRRNTLKGTLPFGPFLAVAAALVFFLGPTVFQWYFSMMGLG